MFNQNLLLLAIILIGLLFRFWGITSSPEGLSIDETSIGYNAWSIVTTGKDEHSISFPLFFKAFGEYKLPVYIYSVSGVQFLTGPTNLSVRLPAVLFGIGTVVCFYLFCRIFLLDFFDKKISQWGSYLAAFLMSISPWHFQFTHAGFEASSALFFITLGIYLFFKARRNQSFNILIVSFVSLSSALYCYNSARIVVPVLMVSLLTIYFKSFKISQWLTAFLLGSIISVPFIHFTLSQEGSARAREVVIFYYPQENIFKEILSNYWKNISPFYLFFSGDPTLSHTTPHRMSLLYFFEWPFFYTGLILLIVKLRKSAVILIWFLIGSIPAAITILNPHALRSFLGLPAILFISLFGFLSLISILRSETFRKVLLGVYITCLFFSALYFLNIYHNLYVKDSGWDWLLDVKKVSEEVNLTKGNYNQIYFEEGGPRTIAYLWHLKYPPEKYQKTNSKKDISNLHFGYDFPEIGKTGKDLYISRDGALSGELINTIYYPNNSPAFYIYRI